MKEKFIPSREQREILTAFAAEVKKSATASEFAKEFCPWSAQKLSKVLAVLDNDPDRRSYFDEVTDPATEIEKIDLLLSEVLTKRLHVAIHEEVEVVKHTYLRAVLVGIHEAETKPGPERLLKYLSPTGGGKSVLCAHLKKKHNARLVESRQSWKTSRYWVLKDIAAALGVRLNEENDPAVMESKIIEHAKTRKVLLVIDEGENFGAAAINTIKLFLNCSRMTILICAIPRAHDRWNRRFPMEAEQLTRRTHATVEVSAISADDAALFFPKMQFKDHLDALQTIAAEASKFGHFSFIMRVVKELAGTTEVGAGGVKKAIDAAHRQMRSQQSVS